MVFFLLYSKHLHIKWQKSNNRVEAANTMEPLPLERHVNACLFYPLPGIVQSLHGVGSDVVVPAASKAVYLWQGCLL